MPAVVANTSAAYPLVTTGSCKRLGKLVDLGTHRKLSLAFYKVQVKLTYGAKSIATFCVWLDKKAAFPNTDPAAGWLRRIYHQKRSLQRNKRACANPTYLELARY